MKDCKLIHTAAVLAAAVLSAQIPFSAQAFDAWKTVNDFQGVPGMSAGSTALQTDASRMLLLDVGSAYMDTTSGIRPAIARGSADGGNTWTILNQFSDPNWQWACYRSLACDANNDLYVGGFLMNYNPTIETWLIRESLDGGTTWSTTDLLPGTPSVPIANCAVIGVAPSGDVYAGGKWAGNWTVRKKGMGQTFYSTVDSLPANSGSDQAVEGIAFHPSAGVFVVGKTLVGSYYRWLVRRSADAGSSWSTVDQFVRDQNWTESQALCAGVGSSGLIYVAGKAVYQKGATRTDYWLVRMSADGGNTWSTVDQFNYGGTHIP
jgi:hypothetical protein